MHKLQLVKIGGKIVDDPAKLSPFLADFAQLKGPKILVHGGGKTASITCEKRGIPVQMVDGRRITNKETLAVIREVYTHLNRSIASKLTALSCSAQGIGGISNPILIAKKRKHHSIDFGFVGDLSVNEVVLAPLLEIIDSGLTPVFNALTQDKNGQVLNTNADTIASTLAQALATKYKVNLIFCFEKNGVLTDVEKEDSFLLELANSSYNEMVKTKQISEGMLPKLDNGYAALNKGVYSVNIKNATQLLTQTGTFLTHG
ncbi:MAG TPA: acetylglutamate kinase [Aequorivita sp.]|nr:acetylglutamate kinase [Aequorivita sp.]